MAATARGPWARALPLLALTGMLIGCTTATTSSPRSTSSSTTPDPSAAARAKAERLAAAYDYNGAIRLLTGMPGAQDQLAELTRRKQAATAYPDNATISHLFYHSLIVDPARAFSSPTARGYDDYMVTIEEFRAQLRDLYDRGFVLVHPERIAGVDEAGVAAWKRIYLPPGKQPLVLSVDDVNYYEYMESDGFAARLTLNSRGKVVNDYVAADGTKRQGRFDVAPIVDDFVAKHPDFSYRGDKGTLGVTGYNGVLGYRSSMIKYGDTDTTRAEITRATRVATALKADGWRFASHSWGHIDFTKDSVGILAADSQRWRTEVEPIVGPTREFIFPFGADISTAAPYTDANAKYRLLHGQYGFDYFFPINSATPSWMQLSAGSLRQARINVDGLSMGRALANKRHVLWQFFDVAKSIDARRPSVK
ncbi:MAG: polysaccharide deacetylase [Tetrasphaera sp.]